MVRRLLSSLISLCLVMTLIPATAFASDQSVSNFGNLQTAISTGTEAILISGEVTLTGDLEIPADKTITLTGANEAAKIVTSGQYSILVKGKLTIQNLQVGGAMDVGYAPITVAADNAQLHTDGMTLENTCTTGSDGFSKSAHGIQLAGEKAVYAKGVRNATVELKNSTIQVNAASARGIALAGVGENAVISTGTQIILDQSKILNGTNAQNEWKGGYSRGMDLVNATDLTVNIKNDSQIAGFQYAINSPRNQETSGLSVTVQNSDIRGWAAFNIWTDGGTFLIQDSTLTGMNGSYNGDKKYSFSTFVINRDIYNNGWGQAENNKVILENSTVEALTLDNQPVETLLRLDTDSTAVEFRGEVTFTDNTGAAGAVLDIGNMDDPIAFMERHANIADGVTVITPNRNSLFPVFEVKNTYGDGKVSYGESFKTFIGGVDYAEAAENKETVILLRNVNEPDFAVNSDEGHGNQFGGWTLDLAGYTLTLKEWSGDKIKVIDSSAEKTGNIIVNGTSVFAASVNGTPYTSLSDALAAAQDGNTVTLLSDIENDDPDTPLNFNINSDIILEGNGHTISGNTALYVASGNQSTTIQNVHFENIHNSANNRSPVYASSLSGSLTITGCTFVNCDWDAIQSTPVAGASIVIRDNHFEITNDASVKGQRFVHIQSGFNTDFSVTVTGNKMLGNTVQEAMGVYYPADTSKVNLSGNYINSSTPLCILMGNGTNRAELAYPMANEDMSISTTDSVLVKDAYYATAYSALDTALANGTGKTVVLIQNVSVNKEISIPSTLTFVANGKTITLTSGGKVTSYLDLNGVVTAASGYLLNTSGNAEEGYIYTVTQQSSGGGSSSGNKTETVTNPDGSTTTTVTKPDGSTTETTKYPDGSKEVVDTKKDGTVTTTTTDKAGNETKVVENTDGSSKTTITNKNGSSSTTTVSKDGAVEAQVKLPASVVNNAVTSGGSIALPIPQVPAASDAETAPTVTVDLPADTDVVVEIPVENVTAGTVAVRMLPDGSQEVITDSVTTENGVIVTLHDGDTVKVLDNSVDFVDVPDSHWASDAVDFATSRELFNGTSATTFSPAGDMTRAMVLTVLARYEGVDTTTGDTWYEAGMAWAVENGISDGTNPMGAVTREQLALMLYRYSDASKTDGTLSGFADASSVSDWAFDAMVWAVENGLINGVNGNLNPQGTASRAEVAAMFMRFIAYQNK